MEPNPAQSLITSFDAWTSQLNDITDAAERVLPAAARSRHPARRQAAAEWPLLADHARWRYEGMRAQLVDDMTFLLGEHTLIAKVGLTTPPERPEPPLPRVQRPSRPAALADVLLVWVDQLRAWHDAMGEDRRFARGLAACLYAGQELIDRDFERLAAVARQASTAAGIRRWWRVA